MYRLKLLQHGNEVQELLLENGREYTFGRGDDCDVRLENQSGISRAHFKLAEENGQWCVLVLSKFGGVLHSGQPVERLALEPGMVFKLASYDFQFLEAATAEEEQPQAAALPATIEIENQEAADPAGAVAGGAVASAAVGSDLPAISEFAGNDEVTRIASVSKEVPFLRIIYPSGREENIELKGRRWTAGREEGVDVPLQDRKASRRHFEITSTPEGFFIRDLRSSNGTLLNGIAISADVPHPIKSGDVIQVGRIVCHFEIRDPEFTKRLMVVAPHALADQPLVVENPYEMINYPVVSGQGGAVRVDQGGPLAPLMSQIDSLPFVNQLEGEKKKKARFWIIVAAVLVPLVLLMMFSGDPQPSKPAEKGNTAFEKLTPQQQKQVKELYVLAVNLYMQQKLALAAAQLQSLHQILPEGYENSLAMAAECEKQADLERTLRELEEDRRRREEIRLKVEKNIRDCEPLSQRTYSMEEMTACLRVALELDPENSLVRELLARVERRIEQKRLADIERREYAARVAKGKALYQRAQALELEGEYLDALEAYRKHAESPYPDPEGLKAISQRQIIAISRKMNERVNDALRAAEAAYGAGKYREAIDHIEQAKKLDPRNTEAAELNARYRREITAKMREMYQEAIISEGLGDVDSAKEKWKKIVETDHPTGEYYKKAHSKLRSYGGL